MLQTGRESGPFCFSAGRPPGVHRFCSVDASDDNRISQLFSRAFDGWSFTITGENDADSSAQSFGPAGDADRSNERKGATTQVRGTTV